METLFISREVKLKRQDNTLKISSSTGTITFPIEKVRHIVLLADSRLNSRLLTLCGKHGVRISVFDYYGYFKGAFEPINQNPSGRVKLAQAELILDEPMRMSIAREIIRGAGHNMCANLLYYQYRGNTQLAGVINEMQVLLEKLYSAKNIAAIMGVEGNLHQIYYSVWKFIDEKLAFGPRVRRPPNNPINCLLSFLNQLTYTVVRHEISKTHLEETFSLLHSTGSGRVSLSLDIAEPFKPILASGLIISMTRRNMIKDNWFEQHDGICLLTETGRKHMAEQFSNRLEEKYGGKSFREWIYLDALGIERQAMGLSEYESFKRKV
jgi:CRISPR-associated protein Cas1